MIIGLTGYIGSGKTTCAQELVRLGFVRIRFAQPLKSMLRELGLSEMQVDGSEKETPSELLCGKTPRHAMQTLGTEWGRMLIGEDLWINAWKIRVNKAKRVARIVCDDVRFPNEAAAVRTLGGIIVRVERPDAKMTNHPSETEVSNIVFDNRVWNTGTIDDLRRTIARFA